MKKILILSFIFLYACSPAHEKQNKVVYVPHIIHGQAATGAFIEAGAIVQARPAAVDGIPCDIIESTVTDDQGTISIDVSKPTQLNGNTEIDSSAPSGFIIRVWSSSASSWVYSYADNVDSDTIANVNPYTDRLVRCFYNQTQIDQGLIDSYFPTGLNTDGSIMEIPSPDLINQIMDVMSNILYNTYGLTDIQNALKDNWQIDTGLDGLIASLGINKLGSFLEREFFNLLNDPDAIISGFAIQDSIPSPVIVEIWTAYGNTGNVSMTYSDSSGNQTTTMIKQSDSIEGNNHFKGTSINAGQCSMPYPLVYITIDDYNSGAGFDLAINTP